MPKLKLKASKLENATVTHISLVERGANRIPFRIIKQDKRENRMIDLARLFKSDKQANVVVKPSIAAFVVQKTEDDEVIASMRQALEDAGFEVEYVEEQADGTVIYKQSDAPLQIDNITVVKMSDELLVMVQDLEVDKVVKSESKIAEIKQEYGYLPSIPMATVGLHNQLEEAIMSGEDVVAKAESIIDDYKSYVMLMADYLPAAVYKADDSIQAIEKAEKPKVKAKKEENEEAPAAEAKEEPKQEEKPKVEEPKEENTQLELLMKALSDKLDTVAGSVETLGAKVSEIQASGETLSEKITEVEAVAKATKDTIKGTVVSAPPAGDALPTRTVKQDDDPRTGIFDSAFIRKGTVARSTTRRQR